MRSNATIGVLAAAATARAEPVMYVSDWDTNAVHVFGAVTGEDLGVVVPARANNSSALTGMVLGPDGSIYLTDLGSDSIRRYDADSGAYLGDFVAAGYGGLSDATDLVFDAAGDLLVANGPGGVLRYDGRSGEFRGALVSARVCPTPLFLALVDRRRDQLLVTEFGGRSIVRYDAEDGQPLGQFQCCLELGGGIAVGGDVVYAATWQRQRIEKFSLRGEYLGVFAAGIHANSLAIGPGGALYVCEAVRRVVEKYDTATGELLLTIGAGVLDDPWDVFFREERPCRVDFNGDGVADFFDYLDFASAFDGGTERADFDRNGVVDFFDYLSFVGALDAGC